MEARRKDFAQQCVIPYVEGHELFVVHDMIKWIIGPVVCRELWHDEPSWGLIIDNVKVERRGEHVVQPPADRVGGALLTISPSTCYSGGCGGLFGMMSAVEEPEYASWALATRGFSISGVCGPNLARIASDSWDFVSRLIFYETRVESELSSHGV